MMTKRKIIALLGVLLVAHLGYGQEVLPQFDALRAADSSSWTITYKYPDEKTDASKSPEGEIPKKGPRVQSRQLAKKNGAIHELVVMDNGVRRESWIFPDIQFVRDPKTREVQPLLKSDLAASDYSQTDFPGLEWVTGRKASQVYEREARKFYLIEIDPANLPLTDREKWIQVQIPAMKEILEKRGGISGEAAPKSKLRAGIDFESKLPAYFDTGGNGVLSYTFSSQPTDFLEMDADFQAARAEWDKQMAARQRRVSAP